MTKLDEILKDFGNVIAELHRKYRSNDERERLDWKTFDGRCNYEEKQAKQQIKELMIQVWESVDNIDITPEMDKEFRQKVNDL